ncbi:MAG: M15 family metallopeptidase [Marmoricola sp.]
MLTSVVLMVLVGPVALPAATAAGEPSLVLTAPAAARIGRSIAVQATLAAGATDTVSGVVVHLQSADGAGGWTPLSDATTDDQGVASFKVVPVAGAQQLQATTDGDAPVTSAPVTVEGVVVSTTLHISGSSYVIDEHSGVLSISWAGSDGFAVRGPVAVYYHRSGQSWTKLLTTSTGWDGKVHVTVRPRWDTYYQARGTSGAGWHSATSLSWKVDNRPPMTPVTLPTGAPRPLALPAQPRGAGSGTNLAVHLIPNNVWSRMYGRSWHPGCPVGRSSLRYITSNYWGFDGYRHRGELVVRSAAVSKFKSALMRLYAAKVPIRAMYLPDRFGKNPDGRGANDVESMKHDNTSAFNCRGVTGNPSTTSPHTYGRALDLNTWENPYHSKVGWLPSSWWAYKQVGRYAWKSRSSTAVQALIGAGFHWTYGVQDSQHFDG